MKRLDPNSRSRWKIEKRTWYLQIPLAIALFIFDRHLWNEVSVLYLVILSLWAPASTADGNETTAENLENLDKD